MAVVKVIEILAQSPKGWEDAVREGFEEVSKTVQGIQSIYVQDLQAVVERGKITQYRVNAKVSFVVRDEKREK
jgi:flavin-binding protein dodecin